MRITKLSLTNFRSFKETQTIDIAPVTLLFGPNSVGKSSVLLALFYLQQILEKGECNPQTIEALGSKYIGGYKNLVNGRDSSKKIGIRVDYDKGNAIGTTYCKTIEMLNESSDIEIPLKLEDIASSTEKVSIEFTIAWSNIKRTAFVESVNLSLNDEFLALLVSDESLKNAQIERLNLRHPHLLPGDHDEWLESTFEGGELPLSISWASRFNLEEPRMGWERDDHFSNDGLISHLHESIGEASLIGFNGIAGALPILGKVIETTIETDSVITNAIINEALSEAIVAPLDDLLGILKNSLCIGPLRTITDSTYEPNPYPKQADWYTGLAALDCLPNLSSPQLRLIHEWLSSKEKLDLGVGLAVEHVRESRESRLVDDKTEFSGVEDRYRDYIEKINSYLRDMARQQKALENRTESDREKIRNGLQETVNDFFRYCHEEKHLEDRSRMSVCLYDLNEGFATDLSSVGVGVSQILPLVVASVSKGQGVISCEQPELHVHPKVQVAIGDLLTQISKKNVFLIETHSEHLILRILKRIRQTYDNELPDGVKPVHNTDISIVYLEPSEIGVRTKKINVNEEGEFLDRWPRGFFSERREELF